MQLKQGSLLKNGEYRIEKVLGQGGFGITYLGVQTGLNRKVAIKEFFMKDFCNREESTNRVSVPSIGSKELVERFRQKFIKEAQTIAMLKNAHIISIHDIFEENGTAYYVMEHVSGGSLKEYVEARGKLPESEALKFIRQIADALGYIHEQKILHLDVKPANVLLDERSHEAILIDFGISKHYDEAGGQTSSSPAGISKGYAPLEQYNQGGVDNFLPCTDIYSLGATLYFMLTGQVPPEASVVNDDGLPPLPSFISASTRKAIEQAMQPKRKERPQSVTAFLALLDGTAPTKKEDKKEAVEVESVDQEATIIPTPQPKEKVKEQLSKPQEEKIPIKICRARIGLWIGIGLALVCLGVLLLPDESGFYQYTLKDDGTYKVRLSSEFKEIVNTDYGSFTSNVTEMEMLTPIPTNTSFGSFTSNGYTWKTGDALPNPAPGGMYKGKKVTDMSNMFDDCYFISSLDLSAFNTINVTDMSWMFSGCDNLTSLDLSGFNTANVTNMRSMFNGCGDLASLDVSGFKTTNVTDMCWMFSGCDSLISLNVSNFNTAKVTDMCGMFDKCSNLTSLDVSGFNTANVTDMRSMFNACSGLTDLDVSGFNTAKVTNMYAMFNSCTSLKHLDLSSFQIGSNVQIEFMFNSCCINSYSRVIGYAKDYATANRLNNYDTRIDTDKLYFTTK